MIVIFLVLCIIIIILTLTITYKNKKYNELNDKLLYDGAFLITLSEFVTYTKLHSNKEIITNDMINAVKTCVNKGLYDVTFIDDKQMSDDIYRSFAEKIFEFVDKMDKE